jgi:glycosyltransferase involved in cell wall biosynthesis
MSEIDVSVVMPTYNEADSLQKTVQSILTQQGVTLELIIVNDGSTDGSRKLLEEIASQDPRVILINQTNQGITKALIEGCKHARADCIARQDAGDWSLPDRLSTQLVAFKARPEATLCSTGTRYLSERGEFLLDAVLTEEEATQGLKPHSLADIKGPSHHGCVMFKKAAYLRCNGYRPQFTVAQDLDLWTRMAQLGTHISLPSILYTAVIRSNSISSKQRRRQEVARQHVFDCYQQRKQGGDDSNLLLQLADKLDSVTELGTHAESEYQYYIGSLLLDNRSASCRDYFRQVLRTQPWHLKAWTKLLRAYWL